eukprot:425299_1
MSLEDQMALETKLYKLTDQVETLQQATRLIRLEKDEYEREVEKLKYNNTELVEKLTFLQTLTKESKQQARLLSRQLSTNSSELDAETIQNRELNKRLKHNMKIVNTLSKENELLKERNKSLQIQLENINLKYDKLETQTTYEIEEYKTKIIDLTNERDIIQTKLDGMPPSTLMEYAGSNSSFVDINDDEEKSYDISDPAHLSRDKTIELKLKSMFSGSYRSQRSGSVSMSKGSVISEYGQRMSNTFLKRQTSARKLQGFPMLAIQQSQEFGQELAQEFANAIAAESDRRGNRENSTVFTDDYDYDEYDDNELMQTQFVNTQSGRRSSIASFASYTSNGQFIISSGQSPKGSNDSAGDLMAEQVKITLMEQQFRISELEELIHREEIGYEVKLKVLNNKNEKLMEQLTEKDKIIKKCTRQITDLKEEYKIQKKKLIDDWKIEKDKLLIMCKEYQEEKDEIVEKDMEKIKGLEHEIYDFRREYMGIKNRLDAKIKIIKKLQRKNKELEMIVTAPPKSSSCYSVTEWFKFS